jgi:osmotically-inducible protein OsmY
MMPPRDEDLCESIKRVLLKDPRLAERPIEVSAVDGIVSLKGTVLSHRRKLLAERLAVSTKGCRGVLNHLNVDPAGPLPDEAVAAHVRASLGGHADIPEGAVTVDVSLGTVALQGSVPSLWVRRIAEDVTLSCRGVRKVENALIVDRAIALADQTLADSVGKALAGASGLERAAVQAAVSGGTVVLSGHVEALWQKEHAEEIASAQGLLTVRNEIMVKTSA